MTPLIKWYIFGEFWLPLTSVTLTDVAIAPSPQIARILFIASYKLQQFSILSKLIEFVLIVWNYQVAKGGSMYGKSICKNPERYTWNKDTTATYCVIKPYERRKLMSGFFLIKPVFTFIGLFTFSSHPEYVKREKRKYGIAWVKKKKFSPFHECSCFLWLRRQNKEKKIPSVCLSVWLYVRGLWMWTQ